MPGLFLCGADGGVGGDQGGAAAGHRRPRAGRAVVVCPQKWGGIWVEQGTVVAMLHMGGEGWMRCATHARAGGPGRGRGKGGRRAECNKYESYAVPKPTTHVMPPNRSLDDLLPLFLYVLVRAQVPGLVCSGY